MQTLCEDCALCVEACPSNALFGISWSRYNDPAVPMMDAEACGDRIRENERNFGHPICGVCASVCPYYLPKKISRYHPSGAGG
jgi:epoxyqueuosine reductase QueG